MSHDRFFARRDQGLEAERLSLCSFSRMGFPRREWADGEPQEVETHLSLIGGECMGYARFRWTQLQPHLCQPVWYPFGYFLQFFAIGVEQDKIIGVPYQERFFNCMTFRVSFRDCMFHSVERYIHE